MLPEAIELVIVTPTRQLLRARAVEVTLPGAKGYLGVLPGHAPLLTEPPGARLRVGLTGLTVAEYFRD